jgi:20S proteasome subunit beta 4
VGPSLYYMDYMASMHKMDFAAHGYGSYFTFSIFDRYYKKDMNLEQGIELMQKCIKELQQRFLVNCPNFICKVVDKNGTRIVDVSGKKKKMEEEKK